MEVKTTSRLLSRPDYHAILLLSVKSLIFQCFQMSVMATNKFDGDAAAAMMKELRVYFAAGKTRSYEWRVSQLNGLIMMMDNHEREIIEALHLDLNKPKMETVVYEINLVKSSCKYVLKGLKNWMKPEKVKGTMTTFPSSAEIVPEPLGVVLVISAWNYPILLSLDPVVGAVAAGNSVVLKPSEIAPATSSLLAKLMGQYMDNSAVRVVEGAVPETTALLDQKWDKIFYTGNGRVGRIVMAAAAKHLTPVLLELGGKCPVVVDSDVDLKVAARRIVAGKWACNNGQACISPDHVIITKDFAPQLIDALKLEIENFYGPEPLRSKDKSRVVSSNHFNRLIKLLDEDEVSRKIVYGGQRDETILQIAPTILLDVPEGSLIMKEEIFGPLLPIVTVGRIEESFDIINSGTKPLAAYLFTNKKQLKDVFVKTVNAGGMVINDIALHLVVPGLPFGGVGESGMGAYHGKFSFDAFSHKKAVLYRGFTADATARYPPYTEGKFRMLRALTSGSIMAIIRALLGWSESSGSKPKSA